MKNNSLKKLSDPFLLKIIS